MKLSEGAIQKIKDFNTYGIRSYTVMKNFFKDLHQTDGVELPISLSTKNWFENFSNHLDMIMQAAMKEEEITNEEKFKESNEYVEKIKADYRQPLTVKEFEDDLESSSSILTYKKMTIYIYDLRVDKSDVMGCGYHIKELSHSCKGFSNLTEAYRTAVRKIDSMKSDIHVNRGYVDYFPDSLLIQMASKNDSKAVRILRDREIYLEQLV